MARLANEIPCKYFEKVRISRPLIRCLLKLIVKRETASLVPNVQMHISYPTDSELSTNTDRYRGQDTSISEGE